MTSINKSHSDKQTLDEWLSYLEHLHTSEIDLGLTRIGQVAKRLAINFENSTVITVAGTNGKGTTCAFLENALLTDGQSVAVYSSPHIVKFNERLRINQQDIDDKSLIDAFEQIEATRQDISLSYYEFTTLAALIILQAIQPNVIILEVGLGGRLDATNIIDADIAVVTTVDLDHQAFLGDTREKIGFEKSGIMRANHPAVVGDIAPPKSVLQHADNIGSCLYCREQAFSVQSAGQLWHWRSAKNTYQNLLPTHIPQANVATALMVLELLNVKLDSNSINQLIDSTKVPGRTEVFTLANGTKVMFDVGHNPQATRYLADVIAKRDEQNIHAVVGMMADKDIKNSLLPLHDKIHQWYLGSLAMPRAAKANKIAEQLPSKLASVNCFDNVTDAYKMAVEKAESTDLILVFGSFFTVAEIRHLFV